jgi:transposase
VVQDNPIDPEKRVIVARAIWRKDMLAFFEVLPRCLVGLEACGSAHNWAREIDRPAMTST